MREERDGRAREERAAAIRAILQGGPVRSQRELATRLKRRGFSVTQATLSRDLRRLGVARRPGIGGGSVYELGAPQGLGEEAVRSALTGFLSMTFSGTLGVVKTLPGYAGSIAAAFDRAAVEGLLATVAGDDTILVIASDGTSRGALKRAIVGRLPQLRGRIE